MPEFKGLDYEKNPEATNKIAEYIEQRLKEILKTSAVAKEIVEIIMIYTSKNYNGDWKNISGELAEALEQEEPKTITKIVEFMEGDLPIKFANLTGDKVPAKAPKLEKRDKPDPKPEAKPATGNGQTKSAPVTTAKEEDKGKEEKEDKGGILDRIKPRPNNNKNKRVKETTEGATEAPVAPVGEPGREGEEGNRPRRDPAKTRCNFWPSCKNTDCPFVHPNQQVS